MRSKFEEFCLIAEIGVNHDGSLETALSMVERSKHAGFDAVKFQFWWIDELLSANSPRATYQGEGTQQDLLESLWMSPDDLAKVRERCVELDLLFSITPFGPRACATVDDIGVDFLKIGSGDATNPYLLEPAAATGRPLVVALGMCTEDEILRVADFLKDTDVSFLHCVSAYPAALDSLNLQRIGFIRDQLGCRVGLSDHSIGYAAACTALGMGATIIEKHVTIDVSALGPDHAASLPFDEAESFTSTLRSIYRSLTTAVSDPKEIGVAAVARKGLYATRDIAFGVEFDPSFFEALRPLGERGIAALDRDELIGQKLARTIHRGERLERGDLAS